MKIISTPVVHQLSCDGPELSKRLFYKTTMERLQAIYAVHGASAKEDLLIKMLAEIYAESQANSLEFGYQVMK